jgi:hypothetical protein
MPRRKPDVTSCQRYKDLTVAQAKAYWDRPGPGHTSRQRAKKGAEWQRSGGNVVMWDRDDNRTTFKCERGQIVGYVDYFEDLPHLTRHHRRAKRRRRR